MASTKSPKPFTANPDFQHHYNEDLACPACGTDSTIGCIAGATVLKPPKKRRRR